MCGGDSSRGIPVDAGVGRSPRVRGRPTKWWPYYSPMGTIPACAGETGPRSSVWNRMKDDPRVCGGDRPEERRLTRKEGRSPRVRGRLARSMDEPACSGTIPACAGETRFSMRSPAATADDPRVCGGDPKKKISRLECRGRSPRVRGRRVSLIVVDGWRGTIPACAGETLGTGRERRGQPRLCGPGPRRARGLPGVASRGPPVQRGPGLARTIPACAGETEAPYP